MRHDEANLARAQGVMEKARGARQAYASGVEDYDALLDRKDLDGVITGHTAPVRVSPQSPSAMKAGESAGVEVPVALSVEDCWELVNTSEKTKIPCMMLENVCYFRNALLVLNIVRKGVLWARCCIAKSLFSALRHGRRLTKEGDLTWRGVYPRRTATSTRRVRRAGGAVEGLTSTAAIVSSI